MQPKEFYIKRKQVAETKIQQLKKTKFQLSMLRLTVFIVVSTTIYFFWGNTSLILLDLILGIAVFLFLVTRYTNTDKKLKYQKAILQIQEDELASLSGDYSSFNGGQEYILEEHYFNQDIDLFGDSSLFKMINRTSTKAGEQTLAHWLNSNDVDSVKEKQEVVVELSQKTEWRQHFRASASLIKTEVPSSTLIDWIQNYTPFIPQYFKIIPLVFSILSITAITLYGFEIITGNHLFYWFLTGILVSSVFVKRITNLFNSASTMKDTLTQYAELLEAIETENFRCDVLNLQQEKIRNSGEEASSILRKVSKQIDYLSNRNNMIFAPIANGFFLWDIYFTHQIENWLATNKETTTEWYKTIEFFDAANSLGNFAFNHPSYSYPIVDINSNMLIKGIGLGHPMIQADKLVRNDFEIREQDFYIITGANMAGKSTFLRTIAVSMVMANCGLPVQAEAFVYKPIRLISSMRTSDSLSKDESYFFSELKRLKYIVNTIKECEYFIILDEILKGTNSKDKAEGSKKFVERLINTNSTGLIATHDLSLCALEESTEEVKNYYFDAQIIDDELFFDYTLKEGVCKNMNASFLLKKMNIVD